MFLRVKGASEAWMSSFEAPRTIDGMLSIPPRFKNLSSKVRGVTAGVVLTLEVRATCFPVSSLYVSR
jgi:hypothetical protein